MAFLEILKGTTPGVRFEIEADQSVIGRNADCEIPLDVAAVSRRHAMIVQEGGRFFVEDLGSRNGTFLNTHRINARMPLRDGDELLICDQTFRFQGDRTLDGPDGTVALADGETTVDDEPTASVMATLDLSAGSASWQFSAKPEAKLAAMVEISNNLVNTLSTAEILPKILDSLFKIFLQADRGFIVMRPKPDGPLVPVVTKSRRSGQEEKMRISRTIVEEAVNSKKAILSADATSDSRFSMAQSITDFNIRSMICAPMIDSDGKSFGVIQIDTLNQRSRFTNEDLEVLAAVASQAGAALDNAKMHEQVVSQRALERDLQLASRVQRSLMPSDPPAIPGYHFFSYYEAARQVGGDYFDFVPLSGGRYGIVVGDVAGKGVSAALLMARLSSDVRFTLASEPEPALAMQRINRLFAQQNWQDKFVTMIVAIVNPQANDLTLINAGHMAPLLRHSGGQVEEIGEEEAGLPLGVSDDFEYQSFRRNLAPGDFVTIYTDGFSEAMNENRDLYGLERLRQLVGTPAVSAADLGEHILSDVRDFVAGFVQSDDMCLACFGRDEAG